MVSGLTRNYSTVLEDVRRVIDAKPGHRVIGVSIALCRGRTVLVADTAVHDMPDAEEIADIAAKMIVLTAVQEGEASPIPELLRAKSAKGPSKSLTLAERVLAIEPSLARAAPPQTPPAE